MPARQKKKNPRVNTKDDEHLRTPLTRTRSFKRDGLLKKFSQPQDTPETPKFYSEFGGMEDDDFVVKTRQKIAQKQEQLDNNKKLTPKQKQALRNQIQAAKTRQWQR